MDPKPDEEARLRSAALQNAHSIRAARQRAEQELIQAKEALERKTVELAHSLSVMRATLESTTDGIMVTDERGHVMDNNENFSRMLRLAPDVVALGEHGKLQEVIARDLKNPAAYLAKNREIYASWPAETFDLMEFTDGRIFERYSKIQRVSDRPVGRVWSYRDVTSLRKTSDELREQREWFQVTLASIGDAVITVDTSSRVTFMNPIAETLTGWSASQTAGRPVGEVMRIVNEVTRKTAVNPIARALAEGIVVGLANHTTLIRRDGVEIPIEDSAAPIKDFAGGIIGAVMVFHDVSDRREKEIALAAAYEAEQHARTGAEQASRAKDHFLATLSHELRTPLTPALAILSHLRSDASVPPALRDDLETVRRNVELEVRLIDDLLDLTRIARGKLALHLERVAVGSLVENAVKTCLPEAAAKHLQLIREIAVPDQFILADNARITQVLWNLLHNAVKFTPEGGTVTIRAALTDVTGAGQLTIEVKDTGIGIASGQLGRIFQAFEQGGREITQQFGGLGLGLAISKAIAEAHRGTISAASGGWGRGSTFTLTIPCQQTGETRPAPSSVAGPSDKAGPKCTARILLVEDHVDTATVLVRLLQGSGHVVMHAMTVASALRIAEQEMRGAGLDLVMSDLGLPDGSGLDLMRKLSQAHGLRGIALSGFGMDSDVAESAAAGFSRHMTKPVDITAMRSAIIEIIQKP